MAMHGVRGGRGRGSGVMGVTRWAGWIGAAAAVMLGSAASAGPPAVAFNQHEIETVWREHGAMNAEDAALAAESRGSGLGAPGGAGAEAAEPDFEEPASVLRFVLSSCPRVAVVYPTETYYYYRFDVAGRRVGGNIRLLDAFKGVLHIGYFDRDDRSQVRARSFTSADGVSITTINDHTFRVGYADQEVTFVLPQRALARPEHLELMDYEEFVSGILDESGMALVLVFNRLTNCFYYVLNPDIPCADELKPIEGYDGRWAIGTRTGFVFYRDPRHERALLVAIAAQSVMENSYFDGPFDQVPPRLQIKEKLEAAYPYTKYRGGIDAHGNFVEMKDQRVAISPYRTYWNLTEMMTELATQERESMVAAERWARLTAEPKQGYDPGSGAEQEDAPLYVLQGWPANHWGDNSRAWPEEHRAAASSHWPANHETVSSNEAAATAPAAEAGAGEAGGGDKEPAAGG